ncbi:Apolipoprotein D [Holothuria leucospilota]|uniref:Apolipoprotein D n=1 Tax=Holothuria leucospilota TaxID=206669 RepID=A0A9Q1CAV2_HOLLE|nr:Apolipoprotein D [Holothuria leucospilota]
MKFSVIALIAVLFVGSSSATWQWGRCRTTTQLEDFDIRRFQGTWYEGGRTNNVDVEEGSRCRQVEYRVYEEGMVYFKLVAIFDDADTNMTESIEGVASFDEENPARWASMESRWLPATIYWVHDTDYDSYAFLYSCKNKFLFFHEEMIWILTRQQYVEPDSPLYQYIADRYEMTELDGSNLVPSEQMRCPSRDDDNGEDDHGDDDRGTEPPRADDSRPE